MSREDAGWTLDAPTKPLGAVGKQRSIPPFSSGGGEVWHPASFGTTRSRVRIPLTRPCCVSESGSHLLVKQIGRDRHPYVALCPVSSMERAQDYGSWDVGSTPVLGATRYTCCEGRIPNFPSEGRCPVFDSRSQRARCGRVVEFFLRRRTHRLRRR